MLDERGSPARVGRSGSDASEQFLGLFYKCQFVICKSTGSTFKFYIIRGNRSVNGRFGRRVPLDERRHRPKSFKQS